MTFSSLAAPVRFLLGLGILLGLLALGTLLSNGLHWPLPGSIVGMALLWLALSSGVLRLEWLEDAADGLLGVLGLLFVPATVGVVPFLTPQLAWNVMVVVCGLLAGSSIAGLVAQHFSRDAQ